MSATVTVTVTPKSAALYANQPFQFIGKVSGSTNTSVNWSVDGIGGGNTTVGTITTAGLYTAPPTAGTHTVKATSVANSTVSASSTLQVYTQLSADFGSRLTTTYPIQPNLLETQQSFLNNSVGFRLLRQAQIKWMRVDANLQNIYNTTTPDWTQLDPVIASLQSQGFKAFVIMDFDPPWLTINPNPCPTGAKQNRAAPTNANTWGQLAASVVAHMDKNFPGAIVAYEIWNEPDLDGGLCVPDHTDATRLSTYLSMYAAAGSAMRAQATADGVQIKIGGPTIVGLNSNWITQLVTNLSTAPYVDFVSYHQYLGYTNLLTQGVTWEGSSSVPSMQMIERDPSGGYAATLKRLSIAVQAGKQSNPKQTPIVVSEYNDDSAFGATCCRNSPIYSPVFNGIFAADMLNAAYTGASPLANAVYFSANTASGRFCLVGLIDANMDCAETDPLSGYPQYFLYKMLSGPGYLDMANGGFMAVSRVPGTAQAGTDMSAFYTPNMDSILVVNPTATMLSGVPVAISNPGSVSASGTMYLLNSTNPNITAQPITLTSNGTTLQTTLDIPGYSVIGISLPVTGNTVTVAVTPNNVPVGTGQTQQFGASVNGSTNQAVTWSVDGISGGNTTVGTIDSFGQYVAPSQTGSHTVTATSVSNPSASGSATVSVVVFQGVKLTISPTSAALFTGTQQQFTATVTGTSNTSVIWAVDGINGGNATVGTVSSSGLYTAPASTGTHSVRATSAADASALAAASVTISSGISANFGGRAGGAAIPSGLFGAQLGVFQNQNAMQSLLKAGFGEIRLDMRLETIYANSTPSWTTLDAQLTNLQTAGMHPLLEVDFTPASLQPATTPCATGVPTYHAAPTDPAQWGQLAASVVAHIDQTFPGLVQDYEIWNEPDSQPGLCVAANTDAARQSAYITMFDAAASAMHQQASTDGVAIRVGGPALGNPVGELSSWIPALLGDATAAANINFVSYHFFPSNQSAVNAGMNWNSSTATTPLYQRTQDASSGVAALFNKASSLVKAGKQPNPGTTPILITDYNDGNGATVDCCRNDPTYGPLWNSLILVDLLNTPYGGAQAVPNRLIYDAASLPSASMCLLGNIDANFDCAYTVGTNPSPYPQYYSYLLFGSSQYLGLVNGGNLATSVTTSAGGLNITAFYTGSADNLVLLNPTGSSVSNVPITLTNSGAVSSSATMFLLNSSTQTISSQPLTLSSNGSTLTSKVTVPAYTTVGISVPSLSSISVTVTPSTASVPSGQTQQFNASVSGTSNQSVTWSVDGVNGGNGTVGTISTSGLYTAGSGTGTHTITATSTASAGSSGTASVTVTTAQTISVSVTPDPVSLPAGQAQQFTATVTGTSNPGVNWSVDGVAGGNSTVGTITTSGLYTAPTTTGSHTVKATSVVSSGSSGSATVTVTTAQTVAVTVSPSSVTIMPSQQQTFTATVTGSSNQSVTWSVDGVVGGNSTTGTITPGGVYTAPTALGSHTATATSVADNTAFATASVTISAGISANFGGRAGGAAIPSGLFGAQLGVFQNQNAMQSLVTAGFGEIRLDMRLETIYANSTPNWTALDAQLNNLQTAGMHPLLEVDFTPASLQPATTPCATGVPLYHAAPTDPALWGQLAASVVAHIDQTFPGLVRDYEIWNEPDSQSGLCVSANTDAARQSAYITMFDAAASAMHQQASTDGVTIRVGGPALGNPVGELSSWIPALLSDATAAANINFVSYHFFPSNQSAVNAGMDWNSSTATTPLYQRTQNTSSGAAALFNKASSLVKAGTQPNPGTTPILITDYNDGNGATVDCCRNDPTYGPLWNSLVLVDLLNTPYGGAQAVPNRLIYDAASLPSAAMCLLGNIDANFDCAYTAGTNPSPYPQYYSYLLFGSGQYLGLAGGGNLATSVTTSAQGVLATGFYTTSGDVIALVNPTGTDAAQLPIQVDNGGFTTNVHATIFLLNQTNGQISSQPLTLNVSGSSYSVTVAVPAYSTVGILIQGS